MSKDLFTRDELLRAEKILKEGGNTDRISSEVVTPTVMARINRDTGQINDRRYMSYRLEYIATMGGW